MACFCPNLVGSNLYGPTPDVFSRHTWPGARVERLDASLVSLFEPGGALTDATYARVSVRGHGRKWQASTAIGAWLDFAELDLESDAEISGFVGRFGDPEGVCNRAGTSSPRTGPP